MTAESAASQKPLPDDKLQELVAAVDTGGRELTGGVGKIMSVAAVAWSLFQLWIASPLPFIFADFIPVLNADDSKVAHLSFAFFLAFASYPAFKGAPRNRVPIYDWAFMLAAPACVLYLLAFKEDLADRSGAPITPDLITAGIGMVLLLEAARRALGPPLVIVALLFLGYVFFGSSEILPDVVRWKGASFNKAMSHLWLTTEGVFGVALGVSTSFVFLFVLFGLLLDKAGAGNYIIKLAFSLLGHFRGGPAKAAVLSSAMTGLISGSSIANVVTTGTFTIPLMKRVGFTSEKAGAVEVASSVNGQIMPPVMGAAAFLMVEYVGISYFEVIKHAFLPALISYIALLYIVHLEAVKSGMRGLPKSQIYDSRRAAILSGGLKLSTMFIFLGAAYFIVLLLKELLPGGWGLGGGVILLIAAAYGLLIKLAADAPDLAMDDPNAPIVELPKFSNVWRTGAYYALPVMVLVWFLMIERKSPGLSAFYAAMMMIFITLTQRPLKAFLRGKRERIRADFIMGGCDFIRGIIGGARNMVSIAIATAAAGIIVGTVSLTGIGLVMAEFVEFISGGNLLLMLCCVAVISLILGMGLPTTANYIVVSSLMAGVVVELGAQSGLIVPLIAVHLFVFYFGIMADVTPPVGLASFAASAVSGGDPIKTGFVAFAYSLRTVLLPFLFIFNTDLLLINVGAAQGIIVFINATIAMLLVAAASQRYFLARNRAWETAALLLVAFTLFSPGYWLDRWQPPYLSHSPSQLLQTAAEEPDGAKIRLRVSGEDLSSGRIINTTVELPLGEINSDGAIRLEENAGFAVREEDSRILIDAITFGGAAEEATLDFDWEIILIETAARDRPPKEIFYLPALALLILIAFLQRRRATTTA